MYRPHDPLTAPAFLWDVYGFRETFDWRCQREVLATFFDRSAAEDFAMHPERTGFERRNVYMAAPRYDRRGA
jgi:hypothetical protein